MDIPERTLLLADKRLARLRAHRAEYDVHFFQTDPLGLGYDATTRRGRVSGRTTPQHTQTYTEKMAIPPILIVAKSIKSLYPRFASIVGVTLATTKSTRASASATSQAERASRTPQPLRRRCHGKTIMPRSCRENVRHVNPWERSPPHRVKADVNVEHRSHAFGGRGGWGRGLARQGRHDGVRLEDGTDDEKGDAHAECGDE